VTNQCGNWWKKANNFLWGARYNQPKNVCPAEAEWYFFPE